MKDLLLINSDLSVNFWAEAIDITNYLHNQLSTKHDGPVFISKKIQIKTRQNLKHIQIFESKVSTFISNKKQVTLDIQKTYKSIFIGYTVTSKYLRVWALCTHLIFITSKPVVNKGKKGANLLTKHSLAPSDQLLHVQTDKLKP